MENNKFSYTYSALSEKERKSVEAIRRRYGRDKAPENPKTARLKKLDAHVKNTALTVSVTIGIISTLVMGFGMSLVLSFGHPILGTIIGLLGILGVISAPLSHSYTLKYQKQKYGREILDLTEELLSGEEQNTVKEEDV